MRKNCNTLISIKYFCKGKMEVDSTSQALQASNIYENVYVKTVILEGELSSAEMQAVVSNNYGKLQSAFNSFSKYFEKQLLRTKSVC